MTIGEAVTFIVFLLFAISLNCVIIIVGDISFKGLYTVYIGIELPLDFLSYLFGELGLGIVKFNPYHLRYKNYTIKRFNAP